MRIDQFDRYCQYWIEKLSVNLVIGMDRNTRQTHIRAGNGIHKAYLQKRSLFEAPLKRMSFSLNPLHRKILDMEKKAFESDLLKRVITNSKMVQKELIESYALPEEKISVIYNGVAYKEIEKEFSLRLEKRKELQASLNLNSSFHTFLFVGNGYKRKGLKPLLEALALFVLLLK